MSEKEPPKTYFDQFFEEQMKNPVFAKAYEAASKKIDKIVQAEKKKKKKLPQNYWNYRLVQYPDGTFGIHEAYYQDGSRTAKLISVDAMEVVGDDVGEIKSVLEKMMGALQKPALRYRKYVKADKDPNRWVAPEGQHQSDAGDTKPVSEVRPVQEAADVRPVPEPRSV